MRRLFFFICIVLTYAHTYAQDSKKDSYLPSLALKSNALYWVATTPNIGIEFGLTQKLTLDVSLNYNPWKFSDNKKMKHWLIQPELRYWICERFNGHFFGVHTHYAGYNMGGIKLLGLENYRYQGNLFGGGISYGYHWILGNQWSVEASVGLGYAHLDYDKYECEKCGSKIKSDTNSYWGPTKASISIIYVIK
ncbi:MAG: DUF3575 domain-containing protein [Dysgonomonas sp.]